MISYSSLRLHSLKSILCSFKLPRILQKDTYLPLEVGNVKGLWVYLSIVIKINVMKTNFHISSREAEILSLISTEKTAREIALELFISQHTVVSHRKNLMVKLNAKNVAGLVRTGFETGILCL